MILGFVTTETKALATNEDVAQAEISDSGTAYWLPGAYEVFSGPHAGSWFVPFTEDMRSTVLRGGKKAEGFPSLVSTFAKLGGIGNRDTINPLDLVDPADLIAP